MESQLQALALIAAMSKKSLRETLDAADFDGRERAVAQALRDGKSKAARETVQAWLQRFGIRWDGKSDIADTILDSLKEASRIRRAQTQLRALQMTLRYRNIAGTQAVDEAMQTLKKIEGTLNGELQQGDPAGERDS